MSKLGAEKRRPKIEIRFETIDTDVKVSAIVNGQEYASETVPRTSRFQAERRVKIVAQDKLRGEGLW